VVSAGIELIFLPVAAGFSTRKMLITLMFLAVGHSSISHVQLMSRCAGAGREYSQTGSPS